MLFSALSTWFFPWWSMPLVTFLVALIMQQKPGKSFLIGFVSIALLWLIVMLWRDIPNEHILSDRMAKVFGLPNFSLLMVVNVFLGGLIGGLAAWCAGLMNRAFRA